MSLPRTGRWLEMGPQKDHLPTHCASFPTKPSSWLCIDWATTQVFSHSLWVKGRWWREMDKINSTIKKMNIRDNSSAYKQLCSQIFMSILQYAKRYAGSESSRVPKDSLLRCAPTLIHIQVVVRSFYCVSFFPPKFLYTYEFLTQSKEKSA